jgi:hemolysin III
MTTTTTPLPVPAQQPARPLLRGWIHAAMTPVALASGLYLLSATTSVPSRLSVAVFTLSMVGLYGTSALYHLCRWGERARYILSRCDVAMIQIFIVGTFTPIAFHTLSGGWRMWSLVIAWAVGIIGAGIAASPIRGPRWLSAAGYIATGWLGVVPMSRMVLALPSEGVGLIVLGALLYLLGAIVYVRQRPNPLPAWFGFHEVFHLLVVAASACHWYAIWRYVIPLGA